MRLTQTVSAGRLQKTAVLAAAPAVAVLEGRRRGAGGAVGLGGAAAAQAGRMALCGGVGGGDKASESGGGRS